MQPRLRALPLSIQEGWTTSMQAIAHWHCHCLERGLKNVTRDARYFQNSKGKRELELEKVKTACELAAFPG